MFCADLHNFLLFTADPQWIFVVRNALLMLNYRQICGVKKNA